MPESSMRTKLLAGLGLVCVSSTVGLLYKVSQATSGGFKYSTTSAIALAELIKLCMSASFHVGDSAHRQEGVSRVSTAIQQVREQVDLCAIGHIMVLAVLYTVNNQLSFMVYTMADPGTVFLFKAASTAIVAAIQCMFVGKRFSADQWKAMTLQGLGMVIVQYNPCKGAARYQPLAYVLMALSTMLTALCAVRNEYLVKNYKIGLNVQNAFLYMGGSFLNVFAFCFIPNPNSKQAGIGFFDGYDNPLAVGVVFVNAMIGLAITAVYKYADAVTKCIASDVTAVVLCILSSIFFELEPSVIMWAGVLVVCFAVYMYTTAKPPQARAPPLVAEESKSSKVEEGAKHSQKKHGAGEELATLVGKAGEEDAQAQQEELEKPPERNESKV